MSEGEMNTGTSADARTVARRERLEEAILPPVVALLVSLVVGDLLILAFGQSPSYVYRLLLEGSWGNPYGIGQVLYKATTFTCTGLAFAVAARAGLFNIGAEGQLAAGGFAAGVIGMLLPAGLPVIVAIPLLIAVAMTGGGVVGAVPGLLRARFGANEVIVTIMLNFVVLAFLNWATATHLAVPETLHTPEITAGQLPRLSSAFPSFHGSAANFSVLVVVAASVVVGWWLFRTRSGYELRATGLQPEAAEYGGVNVGRSWTRASLGAGALAGRLGVNFAPGY